MQSIEKFSDMIEEELEDAEKYIYCAMVYKENLIVCQLSRLDNF